MNVHRAWRMVAMASALAACGSSGSTSDAGTDTGTTTATDAGAGSDAGAGGDTGSASTDVPASADTGPATDAGSGPVQVNGTYIDSAGISGATVEVVGAAPANSTMTDMGGHWSLTLNTGTQAVIRVTKMGYRSVQRGLTVPAGGAMGFALDVVSTDQAMQVYQFAHITEDTAKGVVVAIFHAPGADGMNTPGFSARVSTSSDVRIAVGVGMPRVTDMTTGGENALIFPNVPAGMTTLTPVPVAGWTCVPAVGGPPNVRVDAQVFTFANFECTH